MSKLDRKVLRVYRAAMRWNRAYLRYMQVILMEVRDESAISRVADYHAAQLALSTLACAAAKKGKRK